MRFGLIQRHLQPVKQRRALLHLIHHERRGIVQQKQPRILRCLRQEKIVVESDLTNPLKKMPEQS